MDGLFPPNLWAQLKGYTCVAQVLTSSHHCRDDMSWHANQRHGCLAASSTRRGIPILSVLEKEPSSSCSMLVAGHTTKELPTSLPIAICGRGAKPGLTSCRSLNDCSWHAEVCLRYGTPWRVNKESRAKNVGHHASLPTLQSLINPCTAPPPGRFRVMVQLIPHYCIDLGL